MIIQVSLGLSEPSWVAHYFSLERWASFLNTWMFPLHSQSILSWLPAATPSLIPQSFFLLLSLPRLFIMLWRSDSCRGNIRKPEGKRRAVSPSLYHKMPRAESARASLISFWEYIFPWPTIISVATYSLMAWCAFMQCTRQNRREGVILLSSPQSLLL